MSKKPYWQRWKQTTIANQALVITGVLMFLSSGIYTGTTIYQVRKWKENARQTGEQSDKMIAASERIANTASQQAADARTTSAEVINKAERITKANEDLVKAAQTQANTSQVSARAAERSAMYAERTVEATKEATFIGNRGFLTVRQIHAAEITADKIIIKVDWDNDGNSPVRASNGKVGLRVVRDVPTWTECLGRLADIRGSGDPDGSLVVQPHSTRTQRWSFVIGPTFSPFQIAAVESGVSLLNVCGSIPYETLGQTFSLPFCAYWDQNLKSYVNCKEGGEK